MRTRTTLDVAEAMLPALRDLPQWLIDYHCEHRDALHSGMRKFLWAPLPRRFETGVLEAVQGHGGQYAQARLTTIPGGETFDSQKNRVIKFWTTWPFGAKERKCLTMEPSLSSEVIYLPKLVEGSLNCTYDEVEGRPCVRDICDRLPAVSGLRWIVGSPPPTVTRVLANHLKETGEHMLPDAYTWTDGIYQPDGGSLGRLIVGCFHDGGVFVDDCPPGLGLGRIGLLALGVPS